MEQTKKFAFEPAKPSFDEMYSRLQDACEMMRVCTQDLQARTLADNERRVREGWDDKLQYEFLEKGDENIMTDYSRYIVDDDLKIFMSRLTDEAFKLLENDILNNGCIDPIVIWKGYNIIVDGHHRYEICKKHGIDFNVAEMEFASRYEVKLWMLRNQFGRRNLNTFQRIEIVHRIEAEIKKQAKERQGTRTDITPNIPLNSAGSDSRDLLAQMAGVGHSTYEHACKIIDEAPQNVINAVRQGELTINAEYEVTKMPKVLQDEIAELIKQGETPEKAKKQVEARHQEQKQPKVNRQAGSTQPATETLERNTPPEAIDAPANDGGGRSSGRANATFNSEHKHLSAYDRRRENARKYRPPRGGAGYFS